MNNDREQTLTEFGRRLAQRRRDAELTQEGLASASGLHANYVGDLERGGRNPTLTTLHKLAGGLKCSVADLVE